MLEKSELKAKSLTFYNHVNKSLNPYRWTISLIVALLISLLFSGIILSSRLLNDQQTIDALSPYLITLIESNDRPELLRIVHSIAESKNNNADLFIVKDNFILATNRSMELLDTNVSKQEWINFRGFIFNFPIINSKIVGTKIVTTKTIFSQNNNESSSVVIISPLFASIKASLAIFIITFLISILISFISSIQISKSIKNALLPLNQLHIEIKNLLIEHEQTNSLSLSLQNPINITELDEIRSTIRKTKDDLENAKDQLAVAKAKKLSAEAYKKLIHDLHNPVAALRGMISILNDSTYDLETKRIAESSILRISEQILNQVTAAKTNLGDEIIALRHVDIVPTILQSVELMENALKNKHEKKQIICDFYKDFNLSIPHDPILLQRALTNLIENGIDAAKNIVRITIEQIKNENALNQQDSDFFSIKVCDDGQGMDETSIPIYFQGRGQSNKAPRQAFGLSSTNHIVRSHGGKLIYRKSDLGGSTFEIRLGVI